MNVKNALLASAVASMFLAGAANAKGKAADKKTGSIKCAEANECKGKGSCAGADNACKTQNSCKGHELKAKDAKDCEAKGGKVMAAADAEKKM